MNRRRFLKDATQVGMGLGAGGSLLEKGVGATSAFAAKVEQVTEKPSPKSSSKSPADGAIGTPVISLDGQWQITADKQNVGRAQEWYARALPEGKSIRVPGIIQEALPACHGVVWYARAFVPPDHPHRGGRYLLRFGAVDYLADVWVNGVHVGGHQGGETPFVLDATKAIKPGAGNRLTVRVLNPSNERIDGILLVETPHRNKTVPLSVGASHNYGGILESVELLLAPAVRVQDMFVRPDPKTGKIRIQVKIQNTTGKVTRTRVQFTVAPAATGETLVSSHLERELANGDSLVEAETHVENPRLWDLADPFLYRVAVRLQSKHSASTDEASVRCGFRDFCVTKGYFRLNGKRLFVRSTHTGNNVPIGWVVEPKQTRDFLQRDLLYAKACGFNTVRYIAGMAHPYNLDLCDELGLMVYEESSASWCLETLPK